MEVELTAAFVGAFAASICTIGFELWRDCRQNAQREKEVRRAIRSDIQAIRDHLSGHTSKFMSKAGETYAENRMNTRLGFIMMNQNYLALFDSVATQVAAIGEEKLVDEIYGTYIQLRRVIETITANNAMVFNDQDMNGALVYSRTVYEELKKFFDAADSVLKRL